MISRTLGLAAVLSAAIGAPVAALDRVDVRLTNQDAELTDALRGASLLNDLLNEDDIGPTDTLAAAQADYANLLEVMYSGGYYGAVISIKLDGREAALIPTLSAPGDITAAVITVEPGPVYSLGRADIAPLVPGTQLPENFRSGAPAKADTIRDAAQGAVGDWRDVGFPKANIARQEITARHSADRLDVDVDIAPGRQARFGEVVVRGESRVKPARVRQIAGIQRGEMYDPASVEKAAERLRETGTFRSVVIEEAEAVNPDGSLDLDITVVDRKPRRITAGFEISTIDGATLSAAWLHRNILGGAERLRIEGEITQLGGTESGPDLTLGARFEKPAVYGPDTLFFAIAEAHYLDEPDYLDLGGAVTLGVSREFSDTLTGDLGIKLTYSQVTDRYLGKIDDGDFPTREFLLFSVPTALTWDLRDDELNAKNGYYLRADVEPFAYLIGDGSAGARMELDARAYRGIDADDRFVVAGRVQLGSLIGPDAQDAPPDFLFYSGGGGSVRGQPFKSLDADYDGTRLGGRSFAGVQAELRAGITEKISVVAFADYGYVASDSALAEGDYHAGAGLGLRYDTTIGPIRLDVAAPVAGDTGDGVQLYIGIGQAF